MEPVSKWFVLKLDDVEIAYGKTEGQLERLVARIEKSKTMVVRHAPKDYPGTVSVLYSVANEKNTYKIYEVTE